MAVHYRCIRRNPVSLADNEKVAVRRSEKTPRRSEAGNSLYPSVFSRPAASTEVRPLTGNWLIGARWQMRQSA
jgi:hypothetical protein